jgi:Calreticulin family
MLTVLLLLASRAIGKVYFSEEFNEDWVERWVQSSLPDFTSFALTPGWWSVNPEDTGIKASAIISQYAVSSKFRPFSNANKQLVIQYTLKIEQTLECGGGFIKVMPEDFDQKTFGGGSTSLIIFGPDICHNIKRSLLSIRHKGRYMSINKNLTILDDHLTHQYTLVLNPNNTFVYLIDNLEILSGSVSDHFEDEYGAGIEEIDQQAFVFDNIGGVGINIIMTSPGSIFDNIFVSDDLAEAKVFSEKTFIYKQIHEPKALKKYKKQQESLRDVFNREYFGPKSQFNR